LTFERSFAAAGFAGRGSGMSGSSAYWPRQLRTFVSSSSPLMGLVT
jgi:hypothetical protein